MKKQEMPSDLGVLRDIEWQEIYRRAYAVLKDRPLHHGWQHALDVLALTRELYRQDQVDDKFHPLMDCVALLHDVDDYKFVHHYGPHLESILACVAADHVRQLIMAIVERISWSKERKNGTADWLETMGENCIVRDYVSDADKLLSLGRPFILFACGSEAKAQPKTKKKDLLTSYIYRS
jgi:hypothetical protein